MVNYGNKLDDDMIGMLNMRSVINALAFRKNKITEDELLERFITLTDASHDLVEHELKRILKIGMVSGFIVKTGNRYALPSVENMYEADCDDDESKDKKPPPKMDVTISKPGSPKITVKVEPGTSVSVRSPLSSAAFGSSVTRKRTASESCDDATPRKIKKEPKDEAADLCDKLSAMTTPKMKRREYASKATPFITIDEDCEIEAFPKRRPFVHEDDCVEEVDEEECEEECEEEEDDCNDDDDFPSSSPKPRRGTRIRIKAKGKCGGLSHPDECKY